MIELRVLGTLDVRGPDGGELLPLLRQPKRTALLVYLACARPHGFHRRDRLLSLFWPESDEGRARDALNTALRYLRHVLGQGVLVSRGEEEVGIDDARVRCDARELVRAFDAGELAGGVETYAGELLPGFHADGAPAFDEWLDRERAYIRTRVVRAASELSTRCAQRSEREESVRWAQVAAQLAPDDEPARHRLIETLDAAGDRSGALREYEEYSRWLKSDVGVEPPSSLSTLLSAVRASRPPSRSADTPTPASAIVEGSGPVLEPAVAKPSSRTDRVFRRTRHSRVVSVVSAAAAVAILVVWLLARHGPPASASAGTSTLVLPDTAPLVFVGAAPVGAARVALTLSPDGRRLAYIARHGASSRLVVRPLDGEPVPVSGTEGAYLPFFSPDGEWVAFFTGRELRKVSAHGGPALALARVHMPSGGAWAADGRIVVADAEGRRLFWVPAAGGAPQPILPHPPFRVLNPEILAGTDWLLHGSVDAVIGLHSLSTGRCLAVTQTRAVPRDSVDTDSTIYGRNPRWLPTGHIAYFAGNGVLTLLAFDPITQSVRGPPVPVLAGIRQEHEGGAGQLAVARSGTVAYVQGDAGNSSTFVWVDHATGREDTLDLPRADYNSFRLSPDGRHILAQVETAASRAEAWVLDIDRGVRTPIRTGRMPVGWQAWWPDGRHVLVHEDRRVGATGDPVVRYSLDDGHALDTLPPHTWPSPDGRHLVVFDDGALWLRPVAAATPRRLLARGNVKFFSFSPDGSWLLYTDVSTGDFETYAVPTSGPVARVKISAGGGEEAVWSADGALIVYRNEREWWGVDVSIDGDRLSAGRPQLLFRGPYLQVPGWSHDIARDGRRQLLLRSSHEEGARRIVLVTNWFDEVNGRPP
jgi:DNA-binding SARP family transcriptional activator/Tol biopolymer transport system component